MPTPSIQTLVTDAQQVLNLDSISAVRSVVAVALANANTGTPLNPNLTTQQLWNEFYQVVNKPKSDIESIIANQLMKMLFAPPAPGGVGANTQVIFNDGGVLAGDPDLIFNKALNKLVANNIETAAGLLVGTSATITGDLTVRTDKLFVNATGVGIGNTGPLSVLTVSSQVGARLSVRTSDAIFGTVTGGSGFDSLNDSASALVPFACRGSTVTLGSSAGIGLQLDASNNVNISTGNVVMATSGKGIDFSATASGSGTMTSELLNDYEEGTWVPTLTFATPGTLAVTYSTQTGSYTKVGRVVTARYSIVINPGGFVKGTASGGLQITGLPFAASGTGTQYVDLAASLTDQTSGSLVISYPSASIIYFEQTQISGTRVIRSSAAVDASNFAATSTGFITLNVVLTYTV